MSVAHEELLKEAVALREKLDDAFAADTAQPGTVYTLGSSGHCAAVAEIVHKKIGGTLVSAIVRGESHWFNRINISGQTLDVDITGDQFGGEPVQIAPAGHLYEYTRVRQFEELNEETLARAKKLAEKAGLDSTRNETLVLKA